MHKIDLCGEWAVSLDPDCREVFPESFPYRITLPGTTSCAGLGPENPARETGFLTDTHPFEGAAWYTRRFTAAGWQDRQILLTLERTRLTTVYVDGQYIGSGDSLCTPHRFLLPALTDGEHTLTIRVTNIGYPTRGGHLTAADTQTNWNGITGELSLTVARTWFVRTRVLPVSGGHALHVSAQIIGSAEGTVRACVDDGMPLCLTFSGGRLDADIPLPESLARWDELSPSLHTLTLSVGEDTMMLPFGLRHFRAEGRRLLCNDREVFLRGKHDALLFPLTGYAPCDVAAWRTVLQTAADYGVNHYRFHTCCPPDAAFTAADELGIFMEPELPFWGTVAAEGEEGYNAAERAFLLREGFRMLEEFGHHPSFVMLSMGNELWGSKPALNRMLADFRAFDPDKLYISGSNNFQFAPDILPEEDVFVGVRFSRDRLFRGSYAMCDAPQGIVQVTEPESVSSYDAMLVPEQAGQAQAVGKVLIQFGTGVKEVEADSAEALIPQVPVIAHEVGQYQFYPDFRELDHYTGPLKPRSFEVFRERLEKAGLYDRHERYFCAAGQLAIDCYRREIETFLRTRELAGFQLLDLQDYTGQGTALVGVLNSLMESKGLISPAHWRQFCAGTVALGQFERFVLQSGDELSFGVMISECDPDHVHTAISCTLMLGNDVLRTVTVSPGRRCGRLTDSVRVSLGTVETDVPQQLTVRLQLEDGTRNEYPLWVFPACDVRITREGITAGSRHVRFVSDLAQARAEGAAAIVLPTPEGKLKAEYCTDFWCYPMFRSISESMGRPLPTGTLGLCIDPAHPLLSGFPADCHTTPPWYRILAHAHCEPIANAQPIVEMIDNTERCQQLGILYVQDGYVHLTARLWEDADSPEVRAFALSLLHGLT